MPPAIYSKLLAAAILDNLLTLLLKVLPVFPGSHISYSSMRAQLSGWGDAWRVKDTIYFQVGGFELILDLLVERKEA